MVSDEAAVRAPQAGTFAGANVKEKASACTAPFLRQGERNDGGKLGGAGGGRPSV
jgi:hypothetical protein